MEPNNTLFKSQPETESSDDLSAKEMYTDYTAVLRLPGTSSYEVKITTLSDAGTAGNHVGSTSAIFDASDAFVNGTMLGISEKMDQFKNYLFESFEDGCALKGMVIGVIVGTLATLIIITMVYVLSRY
ncbi:uncharacterized protein LOC114535767 [Dendronephthya gigantea]|uniref:uncharacterized protein LOC114535767 n=1 Tax=Dendronephthya gigantea TaxID=151771 RepID=UPI00106CC10C|nr:uncharacterized protein LOC114535767 [Dendronephthya gigantea]